MTTEASAVLSTERIIAADPRRVFAACEQPELFARWWGPAGFTNTFERFEFTPGGRWVFVMHAPNGVDYPNECVFREIVPGAKLVIEHVVQPWFTLTLTLTPRDGQTHLAWVQAFASPAVAASLRAICQPANEQNLDRLQALLAEQR
jgi:uncharacterized protein YndB with AHSA1/START domain